MMPRRMVLVAAFLGCVCCAARADEKHAELLRELEGLGERLDSARAGGGAPQLWRANARVLCRRMARLPLVEGSAVPLSAAHPTAELLARLEQWGDPGCPDLPSAKQYRRWFGEFRGALEGAQRLGGRPPDLVRVATARQQLLSILQKRAYSQIGERRPNLLARITEMVARYVLRPLFGASPGRFKTTVIIVSLVLLALLIGHMIWEMWHVLRYSGAEGDLAGKGLPSVRLLRMLSGEELLRQGDDMRAGGRYLRAVGFYYLALLSWLAAGGHTRLDRTLTNWEHYRTAAASGQLSVAELRRLAEANAFFDDYCYGGRALSDESVERFRATVMELRGAAHASAS